MSFVSRAWLLVWLALAAARPVLAGLVGCPSFPANSVFNTRIDGLPVDARSAAWVTSIGAEVGLHADFGSGLYEGGPIGIPFNKVPVTQPGVRVGFYYPDESDPGRYPIPLGPKIEGGPDSDGDRHVLVVKRERCKLFEVYDARPNEDGSWSAGSGAKWKLTSNALRPETWTSADAAGLPILPLLVRQAEVARGEIPHALRFTASRTQRAFVWPARHWASDITDAGVPPMGARFRLRSSFDVTRFPPEVQVILVALQRYGMFLADNGSDGFVTGAPSARWDDDALHTIGAVRIGDFEAVDESGLIVDPGSGEARQR